MNRDLRHHQSLKRSRLSAQQSKRSFPKQPARSMLRSYAAGNRHCALWLAMARRRGWNPKQHRGEEA